VQISSRIIETIPLETIPLNVEGFNHGLPQEGSPWFTVRGAREEWQKDWIHSG
jgi:hypothetical protein